MRVFCGKGRGIGGFSLIPNLPTPYFTVPPFFVFLHGGDEGDHQARSPNRAARIQGLVERTLSKDCFEEIELAMESKWLTLSTIEGLG